MMRLMKGKDAADEVYREISERMDALRQRGIRPKLAVVLVEGDPASAYYTEAKRKIAERLTVAFELHKLDAGVEQVAVLELIRRLNADRSIHGIMLELPLPAQLNAPDIAAAIAPEKDIDGVTPANRLAVMTGAPGLYPATPQACIRLLRHYGYELAGRSVALVGRGQTVGLPLFHLLQREQATVTVCHSRTPDLAAHLRAADRAVVAAGKPHLVTEAMVHPGLVVVDAGINEMEDGVLTGDVSPGARELVAAASPVPGGVGALTTAVLFRNLLQATEQREGGAGAAGEATNAAALPRRSTCRSRLWRYVWRDCEAPMQSQKRRTGTSSPTSASAPSSSKLRPVPRCSRWRSTCRRCAEKRRSGGSQRRRNCS